jgi:hypothetical protein
MHNNEEDITHESEMIEPGRRVRETPSNNNSLAQLSTNNNNTDSRCPCCGKSAKDLPRVPFGPLR